MLDRLTDNPLICTHTFISHYFDPYYGKFGHPISEMDGPHPHDLTDRSIKILLW